MSNTNTILSATTEVDLSIFMASNYLLMTCTNRTWQMSTKDKKASAENNAAQGADKDTSYVIKKLFVGNNAATKCKAKFDFCYNLYLKRTLPYSTVEDGMKKGPRLCPMKDSVAFLAEYNFHLGEANGYLDELEKEYPRIVREALSTQGNMANVNDYPDVSEIRKLFSAKVVPSVLATNGSLDNTNIPAGGVSTLLDMVSAGQKTVMATAMDELKGKLTAELSRIALRMSKFDETSASNEVIVHGMQGATKKEQKGAMANLPPLYDSLVSNIEGFSKLLKTSNMSGNAEVDDICRIMEEHLTGYKVSEVKNEPALASQKAQIATSLAERLAKINLVDGSEVVKAPAVEEVKGESIASLVEALNEGDGGLIATEPVATSEEPLEAEQVTQVTHDKEEVVPVKKTPAPAEAVGDTDLAEALDDMFDF